MKRIKKVFISGPMSNIRDFNHQSFFEAAKHLTENKFEVKNPAIMPVGWSDYDDYMTIAYAMLETCDYIYMLPGWTLSRGANLELKRAKELGLKRIYLINEQQQDKLQHMYEQAVKK